MKEDIIRQYFEKLKSAESPIEISSVLDQIIPILKLSGVSIPEIMTYFRIHQNDYETKSQDHQNSISNSNKARVVMELLTAKLNK
ncbi:hypothetical protein Q1W71_22100 [Flavobacterium pectinovorum]|uniref:hypothetical protein n=1 Tax=Flavobacterium pectinovorum TaxID=29533 RepID=UPI0026600C12|nr:hypothetical protein [Flavobacterium pectinovorum]WKL47635.1 hypothetical protein Q1W71_22100 [Flavobacterium pectinovorum]